MSINLTNKAGMGKIALFGGTALALVLTAAAPAVAKDSRVERRVNELEQELRNMKNRIKKLEDTKPGDLRGQVKSGNKKISVKLSGQVNRAMIVGFSKNQTTEILSVDNNVSSSRFRIDGRGRINSALTVGTRIEMEIEVNPSNTTNHTNDDNQLDADSGFGWRKIEFYIHHNALGRLWIGKGSTASDDITTTDLSGTSLAGEGDTDTSFGGLFFGSPVGNTGFVDRAGTIGGINIAAFYNSMDGNSRDNRIRYDSPKFLNFQFRASLDDNKEISLGLFYDNKNVGPFHVAGAFGIAHEGGPDSRLDGSNSEDTIYAGSISALHKPSGFSLTFAAGVEVESDSRVSANGIAQSRQNQRFYYIKAGYQTKRWFPHLGKTALSVDFHQNWDTFEGNDNGDSSAWALGFQFVQKIDAAAMEAYIGVRYHDAKVNGIGLNSVVGIITGARIKF